MDNFIHAFHSETGKELCKYELPAGGQATPMTYTFRGKQYVLIAGGGLRVYTLRDGSEVGAGGRCSEYLDHLIANPSARKIVTR